MVDGKKEKKVLKMLGNVRLDMDKTIIELLSDTDIRIRGLLSLRVKDITLGKDLSYVIVNGKTSMWQIPIVLSAPYLARYA